MGICCRGLLLAWLLCLGSACQSTDKDEKDRAVLTFHTFSQLPNRSTESFGVEYQPGRHVYPDIRPIFGGDLIQAYQPYRVQDGYGLQLLLTRRGFSAWHQISAKYRDKLLVLQMDGQFRSFVRVGRPPEVPVLTLDGPFTEQEVLALQGKELLEIPEEASYEDVQPR